MDKVRAKKHLGQHFLNDQNIARDIADSLVDSDRFDYILEIGPGMGVLTKFFGDRKDKPFYVCEIDTESVAYLKSHYPFLENRIIEGDFLKMDFDKYFDKPFAIIGNFPYNISSQILFRMFENRDKIPVLVGMFQREVAKRVASPPGSKEYGILSVFLQAFFHIEYLFTVDEHVFTPPPKVKSGVIRIVRNEVKKLDCNEDLFIKVVKAGFNQRRKTLRNALKQLCNEFQKKETHHFFDKRAEQLYVKDFVELTKWLELR